MKTLETTSIAIVKATFILSKKSILGGLRVQRVPQAVPLRPEFVTPQDMLTELRADNLHMVESLRRAKDVADQAKDNATSGLIDTWTDEAERRAWFLFEVSR